MKATTFFLPIAVGHSHNTGELGTENASIKMCTKQKSAPRGTLFIARGSRARPTRLSATNRDWRQCVDVGNSKYSSGAC